MTDSLTSPLSADHWDAYWQARDKAITQEEAGARDPAPARFWKGFFQREFSRDREATLIDVACGHGAVTEIAITTAREAGATLSAHCADYSRAAIADLQRRFPEVTGIACDAADIPYPDQRFDYVVSQFGIEYAGSTAFAEAARLVAAGGTLASLVHLADSAIHAECADNLTVAVALRESQLIPLARNVFTAGFDLIAGKISKAKFQEADKRLAPAIETAQQILQDKGPLAAGGLLANLYEDIGYMYTRMQNYVPHEVFAWIDGVSDELVSYEGRMGSMARCALDEPGIRKIAAAISSMGLTVESPDVLSLAESGKPAAWILTARRDA